MSMGKTMPQSVRIHTEYITLGQLLKFVSIIGFGGEAKEYLATHEIEVNGEKENRRGRKLHPGDLIAIEGNAYLIEA